MKKGFAIGMVLPYNQVWGRSGHLPSPCRAVSQEEPLFEELITGVGQRVHRPIRRYEKEIEMNE